jgi:hypothetical protein
MYHSGVKISARIDCILCTAFLQYGVYDSFNIDSDSLIFVATLRVSNCDPCKNRSSFSGTKSAKTHVPLSTSILLFQCLHKFEISKLILYWSLFKMSVFLDAVFWLNFCLSFQYFYGSYGSFWLNIYIRSNLSCWRNWRLDFKKGVFSFSIKYVALIAVCSVTSKHYLLHPCLRYPSSARVVQREMRTVIRMGKRCLVFQNSEVDNAIIAFHLASVHLCPSRVSLSVNEVASCWTESFAWKWQQLHVTGL